MKKRWIIVYRIFTIFMFDTVKKVTSNEDDDIENNTTLSMVDKMELNAIDNAKNITELNTVQNVILNNTNIEYNFTELDKLKELVMKELYNGNRQRLFIAQIVIQIVVIAIILGIAIIAIIRNKYIKLNSFHHIAREYFQKMRSRSYIITINNIEAGSIWDTRQTYNNMLAMRREREALRSIFYYNAQQESHDDNMEFVRIEPQRQTNAQQESHDDNMEFVRIEPQRQTNAQQESHDDNMEFVRIEPQRQTNAQQESHDDNMEFVRIEPQRQTV